jgi:hypothetical protein
MSLKRSSGTVPGLGSGDPDTWLSALFRRPSDETPHVDDQEFVGVIGGTGLLPSGTATWTQDRNVLSLAWEDQAGGESVVRAYSLTPTSAPVTIEAAIKVMTQTSEAVVAGVCFLDGATTTSNMAAAGWDPDVTYTRTQSGTVTVLANVDYKTMAASAFGIVYIRLVWTAADTFKASFSIDGVSWSSFGLAALSKAMTPSHIGVYGWGQVGATNVALATFEYVRVTESDLSV